jgi:hypothetical protein
MKRHLAEDDDGQACDLALKVGVAALALALVEPGTAPSAADDAATAVAWSDLIPVELFDRLSAGWRAGQPVAVRTS